MSLSFGEIKVLCVCRCLRLYSGCHLPRPPSGLGVLSTPPSGRVQRLSQPQLPKMLYQEEKQHCLSVCLPACLPVCLSGVPGNPAWRWEKRAVLSLCVSHSCSPGEWMELRQEQSLPQAFLTDASPTFSFLPPYAQGRSR